MPTSSFLSNSITKSTEAETGVCQKSFDEGTKGYPKTSTGIAFGASWERAEYWHNITLIIKNFFFLRQFHA